MTERVIEQRRKSQLFLGNVVPVTLTYDEFVRSKLKPGKYLTTKTGISKISGMLVLLLGLGLFLLDQRCEETSEWYLFLLPVSAGTTLLVQLVLFLIFAFGRTVKNPGLWIYMDITGILLLSISSLICAIITDTDCVKPRTLTKIADPICMVGSIILIVSCGSIFLMYRFNEELLNKNDVDVNNEPSTAMENPRKSIFA